MGEALKAMVEAMREEVARQRRVRGECVILYGEIDYEQVARAGLAALKDVAIDAPEAEDIELYGMPIGGLADTAFCLTIDAILKDDE